MKPIMATGMCLAFYFLINIFFAPCQFRFKVFVYAFNGFLLVFKS